MPSSQSSVPPEPVDVSPLVMLRQLQRPDGPDRVGQIIARFLEESEERLATIDAAVTDHDPRALEAAAHALKGAAGTVGANELCDIARELEQLAHNGSADEIQGHLAELSSAWERAKPVFEDLRGGISA